ncbi:MAG: glycosyltransferase family 39 protein [Candidatus Electryonea clarkiae]|nr:glycosyltransferase family 39 protein [Candidatus Electryonea clarkiae]MDP8287517.1 glycosyltransferase family 39 protein [Candidatus Electryonea clarkiae]
MNISGYISNTVTRYFSRRDKYLFLELFIVSLLVRLGFLFMMGGENIRINNDEMASFYRALAFADILKGFRSESIIEFFYSQGHWQPLHPMLQGTAIAIFGSKIIVCRIVTIIIAALTTVMVFKLCSRVLNRNLGFLAAVIHLFYPSFVAFSIALWSETTFIFFFVTSVYFLILMMETDTANSKQKIQYSIITGMMLGFAGLTSATIILMLPVILVYVLIKLKGKYSKLIHSFIIFATCLLLWSPWVIYSSKKEGRFVLLSTQMTYYMIPDTNPYVRGGYGSAIMNKGSKKDINKAIVEVSKSDSISVTNATNYLAFKSILKDPVGTAKRTVERVLLLGTVDYISLRSLFSLQYVPLSKFVASSLLIIFIITHISFIAFFLWGLGHNRQKSDWLIFFLILIFASLAGPVMSAANPRHALIALVIALPTVAYGISRLGGLRKTNRIHLLIFTFFISILFSMSAIPMVVRNHLFASSVYSKVLDVPAKIFGLNLVYNDNFHIVLKKKLGLEYELYAILIDSSKSEESIRTLYAGSPTVLQISRTANAQPPTLLIRDNEGYEEALPLPDKISDFGEWIRTGLPGLIYKWERTGGDTETQIGKYLRALRHSARLTPPTKTQ